MPRVGSVHPLTELCERYGISRKTGYKWRHGFEEEGVAGLAERSRAPRHCPHQMPDSVPQAAAALDGSGFRRSVSADYKGYIRTRVGTGAPR